MTLLLSALPEDWNAAIVQRHSIKFTVSQRLTVYVTNAAVSWLKRLQKRALRNFMDARTIPTAILQLRACPLAKNALNAEEFW